MRKDVSDRNRLRGNRAQNMHSAKTNVLPLNIDIGDYVIVRMHYKMAYRLLWKCRTAMRVKEAKSNLVYVVEYLTNAHQQTLHVQKMITYPVTNVWERATEELMHQAEHFDKTYHLIDEVTEMWRRKWSRGVKIRLTGSGIDDEMIQKPLSTVCDDS